MKRTFRENGKKDFQITVTDATTKQARILKAKNIISVDSNENQQGVIIYRLVEGEKNLEEIVTVEDKETIIRLLNGDPDPETKDDFEKKTIRARKRSLSQEIEDLKNKYHQELEELEQEYNLDYNQEEEEFEGLVQSRNHVQDEINETRRGRIAKKLSEIIAEKNSGLHHQDRNVWDKIQSFSYHVIAVGSVGKLIQEHSSQSKAVERQKNSLKRMVEGQKRGKDQKEQAFNREKQRLIRLRDHPGLSTDDRSRLEARIDEYRLEHGDRHNFLFKEQPNGKFENQRGVDCRQKEMSPDKKEFRRAAKRGRSGRSRSRSLSR